MTKKIILFIVFLLLCSVVIFIIRQVTHKESFAETDDAVFWEEIEYKEKIASNTPLKFIIQENSTACVIYDSSYVRFSSITIPATAHIGGHDYRVTRIGDFSFQNCTGLTNIEIPFGVTEIGSMAFSKCENLKSITIPTSTEIIGLCAFEECRSLTNILIPASVRHIGNNPFCKCSKLRSINVYHRNSAYSSENGILYDKDKKTIIAVPNALKGKVTIPSSVTTIEEDAFFGCSINEVSIPNSVTEIKSSAFRECVNLKNITLPPGLMCIESYAFCNCDSLSSINIPKNITEIRQYTFSHCISLTDVTIPQGVTYIEDHAFEECTALKDITIPSGVTVIKESVFDECENLKNISVVSDNPNYSSVNGILCNKEMTEIITVPQGIKGNINIPFGITRIKTKAFIRCDKLTSINIPSSVTDIEKDAFRDCRSLSKVTLSEGLARIEECAFGRCIGDGAFWGCEKLNVVIDNGRYGLNIGEHALDDCKSVNYIQ